MLLSSTSTGMKTVQRSAGAALMLAAVLVLTLNAVIVPLPAEAASLAIARTIVVPPKHKVPVLLPVVDQPDIKPNQRILADQVLRALPSYCRDNLKNFYVTYDKNPSNRGLGGESTIIVTGNVPDKEFMALVTHECGHVTDIGGLRGADVGMPTTFFDGTTPIFGNDPSVQFYRISWLTPSNMQPGMTDADFVSGYAESDPFEDFAETFAFYALHKTEFQRLAKKNAVLKAKYDFIDKVVFSDNPTIASSTFKRGTNVPWDVTKLPYVWHAKR